MTSLATCPRPVNTAPARCPRCGTPMETFEGERYCPRCLSFTTAHAPVTGYVLRLILRNGTTKASPPFTTREHADRVGKLCRQDPAVVSYAVTEDRI